MNIESQTKILQNKIQSAFVAGVKKKFYLCKLNENRGKKPFND